MPARLGQHFLVCPEVVDSILAAADVRPGETVLEIGPGKGALTARLLAAGARVSAVEMDERLAEALPRACPSPLLSVARADFLELDLRTLPSPVKVVANLPYSVATPILQRLLDWPGWETAVLMFQKEVAERLLAAPGGRKYSLLTLSAALKADVSEVCAAPARCFEPPPRVDSLVVRLARLPRPRLPEGLAEEAFFRIARAAFSQRRKLAAKSVAAVLGLSRERVDRAFAEAAIAPSARAEEIALESFVKLVESLR